MAGQDPFTIASTIQMDPEHVVTELQGIAMETGFEMN